MWWFFLWESIWKNRILTNILALKNKGMHAFPYVYICLIDVVISFLLQYTKWISQYNKCNIQSRSHSEVPLKIGSPKKQTKSWHIFKWFYFWMKLINKELIIQGLVIIINVLFNNFAKTYMFCPFYIWTFYNNFSRIWLTNGKLYDNGFLQYSWRQSFVPNLESVYLFWCLHFDISSVFLFSKIFPR